jgi:hypothetical protein
MFFRRKRVGSRDYLQIVRNQRVDGRHRQSVVATLESVADLEQDGPLARLPSSGARVCEETVLLSAPEREQADVIEARRIGAPLIEWAEVVFHLERLLETMIEQDNKRFLVRTAAPGCSGAVFKAVGVALPAMVRSGKPPPGRATRARATPPAPHQTPKMWCQR